MLLLELKNIVKYVGARCLFKTGDLKIYSEDKIGLVGVNGVGKTVLLKIMAQIIQPDEGEVLLHQPCSYLPQLDAESDANGPMDPIIAKQLQAAGEYTETMSGGEKMRYRIAAALSANPMMFLADEPTANLDIRGIETLEQKLQEFEGGLVLVSHDRELLESVCNMFWEIENEKVSVYRGNFRDYLAEKKLKRKRQENEYRDYRREKEKLEAAVEESKQRAQTMKKAPRRMGNSEARLHKRGNQKAKKNLDKAVKAIETRLQKLEVKERPQKTPVAVFDLAETGSLHSKVVLQGERLNKRFGSRILFDDANFCVCKDQKVALVGDNGCGKTTLLKMIAQKEGIDVAPGVRFGYFGQACEGLDLNKSVLANVMESSIYDGGFVRSLLAQLLFRRDDVFKRVSVLSGGERARVALAKIIAGEANVLLLDEPTNYLDMPSLAALETVLAEYNGVIVFASHDRGFINAVATHLILFKEGKLFSFTGNYRQYLEHQKELAKKHTENQAEERKLLLENKLAEVLGKLSLARDKDSIAELDREYQELLRSLGRPVQ